MKTKLFSIIIIFFTVVSVFSQANLNNYKYVIVPTKYEFLKQKDQYQLNSLTKFLFDKYGFEAIMEGSDYPIDLVLNRCLALKSDLIKDSNMFKTKLTIELKDCNDKVIFTSAMGESREKEYKTAYNLALREAFKSIGALNYKYVPNENTPSISTIAQTVEKPLVEKPKVEAPVVVAPIAEHEEKRIKETTVIEGASNMLYAQVIPNGFQLVDSSPKVVYKIKRTNLKDVFLVDGTSAIIYKNGDDWVIEYYVAGVLEKESLNIKF